MSEIDVNAHNTDILNKVGKLEDQIKELKKGLKPAVLPKQASLQECNAKVFRSKPKDTKRGRKKTASKVENVQKKPIDLGSPVLHGNQVRPTMADEV